MKNIRFFILALFVVVSTALVSGVEAQPYGYAAKDSLEYKNVNAKLNRIENQIKKPTVSSKDLSEDIEYLRTTKMRLENSRKDIENDVKSVEKRLEALGNVPEDGHEDKLIARERKNTQKRLIEERSRQSENELLLVKIDELDMAIFNLRNQELWGRLLVTGEPIIYPSVFLGSGRMFLNLIADISTSPFEWYNNLTQSVKDTFWSNMTPVILAILFITAIGWGLRRLILRNLGYMVDIEHPRFGRKVFAAVTVWIAYGVIPTLIIGLLLAWVIHGKILTNGFFGVILNSFLYYSLYVIMCNAICRVIFTPYNERWRLIKISTEKAKRVIKSLYISITLIGVMAFLQNIVNIQHYPVDLMSMLVAVSAIIKAFCIVWVMHRLLWDKPLQPVCDDEIAEETDDEENEEDEGDTFVLRATLFSLLIALAIMGLSVFGYPYLADFITDRIILTIILIVVMIGLRISIYEILHRILFLKFWFKTFRMRRKVLRKLDFWSSFLVNPSLAFGGFLIFLALWGVPSDVLQSIVYKLLTGFMVGDIRISLLSIVLGIVVFFASISIVKALRQKIENGLLSKMEIEDGTRHSLAAGFSSIGYVASALLAVVIMGGNLTSLALVAGALSVGIGLGLQNVVNNFVSGIILLFERPIKVGDWVIINGEEGKIKQINIRATEMETFNRASLIIPNADLLSNAVTNLTHGNNWARKSIKIGVAYGTDVEKVRDILLECASHHKKILRKPEPYVIFQDFGASSLDFELRFYIGDIWSGWGASSDLRYEIYKRFNEEGIEIPFNQLVVYNGSQISNNADDKTIVDAVTKPEKDEKNAD